MATAKTGKQIPLSATMTLSASETRHYGTFDKTFSTSQMFAPSSKVEMQQCMTVLNDRLALFFEDYELNSLQKESVGRASNDRDFKQPGSFLKWYDVAEIIVDVKEGKPAIKIKTRQAVYNKFGVMCYDEVSTEFKIPELMQGGFSWKPIAGKEVKVQVDDTSKHHKAVNFEGLEEYR